MKNNTISSKIKIIGLLFIILMSCIIFTTIYLNEKNKKDALVINIAGKERMLTQKISKNIFYLYHNNIFATSELDIATVEFIYNLNSLKNGNELIGIQKSPTNLISNQISKVEILWNTFFININSFKENIANRNNSNKYKLKSIVDSIYDENNILLNEVDKLVSMYTVYSEKKTDQIRYIQFIFGLIIIFLIIYSFIQLKAMEDNAKKFFEFSKKLVETSDNSKLEPIKIEAETEIVEASNTINYFIEKVNSAVNYSQEAIDQSKNASVKLEEITDEFYQIIEGVKHSNEISNYLDKSEDMFIQSQEDLINSTEKLNALKNQLNRLRQTYALKNSK